MKSILFVGNWPKPFGGIASHLYELLPGIAENKYNITILTFTETKIEESFVENGVKVIRFSPSVYFSKNFLKISTSLFTNKKHKKDLSFKKYFRAISIASKINQVVKNIEAEFIFTYGNDKLCVNPFIENPNKKIKLFNSIYGAFYLKPELYENEKQFLRHAITYSDKVLSCSQYCVDSAEIFLNINYPKKVFYNNVNEKIFSSSLNGSVIREKHDIPTDSIVLITMGRMIEDMGIDFLLDNLIKITSISKKLIVFFVGAKGNLCSRVISAAESNNQVRFAFDISNELKPLYYACADIFTAPTKDKQACMGIANIEAMMSKKAIISSSSGGHLETIEDQVSGILVPFKEGEINDELYLKYLSLLVNNNDIRNNFAKKGYQRALKLFTNDHIVKEHVDFIEENSK
jgi:glycosyltransferase involved in cell wall biosynthesis